MNFIYIIISFVVSALVALIALPRLLDVCHKYRLYDLPSERKVHKNGIPRLGGVVFIPAMLLGMLAGLVTMEYNGSFVPNTIHTSSVLIGTGVMTLYAIGIADDLVGMTAVAKFGIQFLTAITFPVCGLYIDSFYGFLGIYDLPYWVSFVFTVFLTMLIVNAINLIDGIDGLAACLSLIALTSYGYLFYNLETITFALFCASLSGALVIYTLFNIWGVAEKGTKTFMGDSGSLFLGIVLSYFTVKYAKYHSATLPLRPDGLLVAYTTLIVPCFDLIRVAFCRLRRGQGMFKADKTHIHHKMIAAGFTMPQALIAILLIQIGYMILNFTLFAMAVPMAWIMLADIGIFTLINVLLPVAPEVWRKQQVYDYYDNSLKSAELEYDGEDGLVTIIMPTFNASRFVSDSIDSILSQTYTNWELIITDDHSTDNTLEIVNRYASRDSRIKVMVNAQNSGAGFSRNVSIEAARGRYIAFCDSDDRWMSNKLEIQLKFMREQDVNICFAPYYTCNEHSDYLGYIPAPCHVNLFSMICDDKIGFLTCIYDANQCGKHYMPLQRKRQDYAFLLNLMRTCPHAYSVQEALGHYRLHQSSISANKISLVKYNALTYHVVFGWSMIMSYAVLFVFFLPSYFWKRTKNLIINISRTQLG